MKSTLAPMLETDHYRARLTEDRVYLIFHISGRSPVYTAFTPEEALEVMRRLERSLPRIVEYDEITGIPWRE